MAYLPTNPRPSRTREMEATSKMVNLLVNTGDMAALINLVDACRDEYAQDQDNWISPNQLWDDKYAPRVIDMIGSRHGAVVIRTTLKTTTIMCYATGMLRIAISPNKQSSMRVMFATV